MLNYQNIKAEMTRSNLNQKELAEILDVSPRTISLKLSGVRKFTAEELFKLSQVLKVDINIFLNNK